MCFIVSYSYIAGQWKGFGNQWGNAHQTTVSIGIRIGLIGHWCNGGEVCSGECRMMYIQMMMIELLFL